MTADELRNLQAPLKSLYRSKPESALKTLKAEGRVDGETISCSLTGSNGSISSGLHPAAGGDGSWACSADMLLQSLVACAGVTLAAVAKSMGLELGSTQIHAEGDIDFRGTLGINKDSPIGFKEIRLFFDLDLPESAAEQAHKLIELTERYCVIYRTLKEPAHLSTTMVISSK